ncbi:MAG: hypothetical protein ACKVH8_10880 [Pirellulales bacterium]
MSDQDEINPFESPQEAQVSYESPSGSGDSSLTLIVSVSVGLLILCTILLVIIPGLGVLGFLVSIPGVIHGAIRIRRKRILEGAMTRENQFNNLLISLLIMVPVVFASSIGFGVFCFGGFIAVQSTGWIKNDDYGAGAAIVGGLPAGLLAALIIGILLFIFTLPKKLRVPRDEIEHESK